jgi:hypothetical protein
MKDWKSGILLLAVSVALSGCTQDPEDANAEPNAAVAPDAAATAAAPAASRPAAPAAPRTYNVAQGTEIDVALLDALNSGSNKAGDEFMASLAEPIVVNGTTVVERGTRIHGRVVDAEGSGRVSGRATMRLVLTGIMQNDKMVPIVTQAYFVEADGTRARDAGVIGAGAGIGAAIGAIAGGGSGAKTGAIIGGAAGTGTVLATKGNEVEFAPETRIKFTLEQAVDLPAAVKTTT